MSYIDVANTGVFFFGTGVFILSLLVVWRYAWKRHATRVAVVVFAFVIDDAVDGFCTLAFASNALVNTWTGELHVNSLNPWLAVALRLLIFGSSGLALSIAGRQASLEETDRAERIAAANRAKRMLQASK